MKKFYSFMLIVLSLFSCVLFSACGDKYRNLRIDVYSSSGGLLEELRFVIDERDNESSETISISLKNIDKDDVGQIVVYSVPNNLITPSDYRYNGKTCSVTISPERPCGDNAKLVVSHLASGKKKQIPLIIDQKSGDVEIVKKGQNPCDKYIVSIPQEGTTEHILDLNQVFELKPGGSTDNLFFKVDPSIYVDSHHSVSGMTGVSLIPVEGIEGLDKVYKGIRISYEAEETIYENFGLKIYPVTYLEDFKPEQEIEDQDKYSNKLVSVLFKKVLNESNVAITSEFEMDYQNIQLISNDESLNSYKLTLKYLGDDLESDEDDDLLLNKNFFSMYEIKTSIAETYKNKVSAFTDVNNDILINAHTFTEQPVEIKIFLNPINYVGDIKPVELSVKVKGELSPDKIVVSKDGENVSTNEKINIFDYYETSSSLGSLFVFDSGEGVHEDLNKMRILVAPSILCEQNVFGMLPENVVVNDMLYSLMFSLVDDYLQFTYDGNLNMMVSAEIDRTTKVYIKYIIGNGGTEPLDFEAKVQTINNSTFEHWSGLENIEINLDFNRMEGVKSMELKAGYYHVENFTGVYSLYSAENIQNLYLNRLEGLDCEKDDVYGNFIYVDDSVKGIDDGDIDNVEFEVSITPLKPVSNPLKLYNGGLLKDDGDEDPQGVTSLVYKYSKNVTYDVIGLVYRKDTSLGEYKITFSQEKIVRTTLICKVYEDLTELKAEYVSVETNDNAFKNTDYPNYEADYIVAKGEKLGVSVSLPESVIQSGMFEGFEIVSEVVTIEEGESSSYDCEIEEYFTVSQPENPLNLADLVFNKGTFIEGQARYICITIKALTYKHENIVSPATLAEPSPSIELTFFVYETITEEDVEINYTTVTRHPEEFLAVDYKHLSELELKVNMTNGLWNYVTSDVNVIWNIDGENLEFNYDQDGDGVNDCYIDRGVYITNELGLSNCKFTFQSIIGLDDYTRVIKAFIMQFDTILELQCLVFVEKPIITERLIIKSKTEVLDDANQTPYINLKLGEKYQVLAENISSLGQVTRPGITIQVADIYGNAYSAKNYFEINSTTSEITVKNIDNINRFKLIIFAKDALIESASQDKSGYNMPSIFLMEGYKKAYFVIDIYLSDGSEANPYLIKNAYDFWAINDNDLFKQAHYKVMTNISLDNVSGDDYFKSIDSFSGDISTFNNTIYSIDGIYLDNDMKNLFTNFTGSITNIKFSPQYAYELNSLNDYEWLGLIDKNNGTLTNVGVDVRGYAKLSGDITTYYFGGLAGENLSTIQYKEGYEDVNNNSVIDEYDIEWNAVIGADGSVDVSGTATIFVGGLVGKNVSSILGCETNAVAGGTNNIILNVSGGRGNSLSQLTINAKNLTESSAVGGVVGLNSYGANYGIVQNGFVQAIINAENTSNVGGVIGKNDQEKLGFTIKGPDDELEVTDAVYETINEAYLIRSIYNIKSISKINAYDNVGGIVGLDSNGVYLECDYQILTGQYKETAITGNNAVGGIAGMSDSGKFIFCSIMSYNWNYSDFNKDNVTKIDTEVEDIFGLDYVGGIVGLAVSDSNSISSGNSSVKNKVVIVSSSVNANLKSENNIGGIISSEKEHRSVLFNVYFMGIIKGNVNYKEELVGVETQYFVLDNNGDESQTISNAVYSLNIDESGSSKELKVGKIRNKTDFKIDKTFTTIPHYWAFNEFINGGYIFITKDQEGTNTSYPIFDLAPDSINVLVNGKTEEESLARVLRLEYYDFSIDENATDEVLSRLIDVKNRSRYLYKIRGGVNIGLLDITAQPSSLGSVVVNVKSTNTSIVDITYDGKLIVNGIGKCELIFSSILNPNAGDVSKRTITVVVDYPIGNFNLSSSRTDISGYIDDNYNENIGQGSSKQYYIVTNGIFEYNGADYKYRTKSNLCLEVEFEFTSTDSDFDYSSFKIEEHIQVRGKKNEELSTTRKLVLDIDDKTPFVVKVLKRLVNDGDSITVKVTPYVVIEEEKVKETSDAITFNLNTREGVTNASFSYDDAIVYPNDVIYLNAYVTTDLQLDAEDIFTSAEAILKISSTDSNYTYVASVSTANSLKYLIKRDNVEIGYFIVYIDSNTFKDNLQKIKFRIEFSDIDLNHELNMQFMFELRESILAQVDYTILPQRINKIEIKNYYYRNTESGNLEKVQQNILKPNNPGEMIIDIVPNNGYYDYLEISDITGNEEIVFIQVDENGNALSVRYDPSSDGKGIKLYDYSTTKTATSGSRIYIKTQISKEYSSKLHTIEVRAYTASGKLIASNRKYIEVKMLPEIEVTYCLPNGQAGAVSGNADNRKPNADVYLANGVDSNLIIKTLNSNTDVEIDITSDNENVASNYEVIKIDKTRYELNCKTYDDEFVGEEFKITFTTYSILENGDFDIAQCSIDFTITTFVIHGVSVTSSNSSKTSIEGYYNREIDLEFYFDVDDISFYDTSALNGYFHKTQYVYEENYEQYGETYLKQIYEILYYLNSYDSSTGVNQYLILNNGEKKNLVEYKDEVTIQNITLNKNVLKVEEGYTPDHLAIAFKLTSSSADGKTTWSISTYETGVALGEPAYIVDKNYRLNFRNATNWYEPTVINSKEDFEGMEFGGRYILNVDLIGENALTNYKPIDTRIIEFDGNGHTIEIKSFAPFEDPSIKAGLFAQVYGEETIGEIHYPAMVVKNIKVKYVSGESDMGQIYGSNIQYVDLCGMNSIAYTDAKFGGIAAVNNGAITNCFVEGFVALRASYLEEKSLSATGNYEIDLDIGGVVAENTSIGYITNTSTELNIFAQANVGGFVHTNAGKISSCGVEEDTTIYGYNQILGNTIVVEISGFVVENSGKISMSYVNLVKQNVLYSTSNNVNIHTGTMSAKDFSSGFVFRNRGEIYDSYVQISHTGVNNNRFAGFADSNSGTITRVYAFVNSGKKASKDDVMFVAENLGTIDHSIQFVVDNTNSNIEELHSVSVSSRNEKACYQSSGFAFGDNKTAVWSIQAGAMPKLVSTQELSLVNFRGITITPIEDEEDDDVNMYDYNFGFENYGSKYNPYIISDLETWHRYFKQEKDENGQSIELKAYYRIVRDIDFSTFGNNPETSSLTFSGNIQGNNMVLSGIMLYLPEDKLNEDNEVEKTTEIGLFGKLIGSKDKSVDNSVRNLTLKASSVWASSTRSVGVLAGIVENFNLYNLTIDSNDLTIVGGNAVGGLAGLIRGQFDIENITSNVGANSTRATTLVNYSIYMSVNNGNDVSYNLDRVYYAGSVAGILDAYDIVSDLLTDSRDINNGYYNVRNINVNGDLSISGDTVGAAFGLVGEKVKLDSAKVNVTGLLFGEQYSGGVVGENRGVVRNSSVTLADDMFKKSKYVSAGAVGFNMGGFVDNVEVKANIVKNDYAQTSGGIIGRNLNGVITNVHFDGELKSYFAGGIIGSNYTQQMFIDATIGTGSINEECKLNENLLPESQIEYKENSEEITNFSNISISLNAFNKFIENSKTAYSYKNDEKSKNKVLNLIVIKQRVHGLIVGLSCVDTDDTDDIVSKTDNKYNINLGSEKIIFNATSSNSKIKFESTLNDVVLKNSSKVTEIVKFSFSGVNVLTFDVENPTLLYLVGAETNSFDSWGNYSNDYILLKKE